jgi:hypothetical protein
MQFHLFHSGFPSIFFHLVYFVLCSASLDFVCLNLISSNIADLTTVLPALFKFCCKYQQPENCENRNDPDLVQAFLKKWWVESDFIAPNPPPFHDGSKFPAVTITVFTTILEQSR